MMKMIMHNLGFPRNWPQRELKKALEGCWSDKVAGIDLIPSNDFSLYDHVLDMCALVGTTPPTVFFGLAATLIWQPVLRWPVAQGCPMVRSPPPMEMTKWFDTNHHYLVSELHPQQTFRLASTKPFDEFSEAKTLGIETVPVLLGPVSFLLLGKARTEDIKEFDRLLLLPARLPVCEAVLRQLESLVARWVQFNEPVLLRIQWHHQFNRGARRRCDPD